MRRPALSFGRNVETLQRLKAGVTGLLWATAVMSVCIVTSANAAVTGDEYSKLPTPLRLAFVAGVLDGWEKVLGVERSEQMPSAFGSLMKKNFTCLSAWGNDEYRVALDAYFSEHEAQMQYGAASGLIEVMARNCSN